MCFLRKNPKELYIHGAPNSDSPNEEVSEMYLPNESPLTRHSRNLDAAEQRCEKLTALLKSLNPDIDIEQVLKNGIPSAPLQPASNASPKSPEQVNEASPGSSHEYEWHEAPLSNDEEQTHSLRDGMALLSTDPSESGYIGIFYSSFRLPRS